MPNTTVLAVVFIFGSSLSAAAEDSTAVGEAIYSQHCIICHGEEGLGGEAVEGLHPPDLTKIADRRGSVWPMLEIMSIIDGYAKTAEPRVGMPVLPELSQGPEIDFDTGNGMTVRVPSRLVAVVSYLESIQSPQPETYVP